MSTAPSVRRGSTPGADRAGSADSLSPLILKLVAPRLALGALLYSALYGIAWGSGLIARIIDGSTWNDAVTSPDRPAWLSAEEAQRMADAVPVGSIAAVASITLGLVVFAVARRRTLSSGTAVSLTSAFAVLSCFGIAIAELWGPRPPEVSGISWVCFWITIFPMLVPMPPARGLLTALGAASTVPIAYAICRLSVGHDYGGIWLFFWFFPPYIAALGAYLATRFVYRLSRDAARAQELGSYRLVQELGRGGMGEVWRAKHKLLARPAAVKLIRPEYLSGDAAATATLLKRFEREARATSALESPNTIELYDFGTTDDGTFFYVMELLDGIDTELLVDQYGPQPASRAAYILRQVCNSLEDAHKTGLLHRDIKPANIFVCRRAFEYDFVKVLDFGLVKELEHDEVASRLTADGIVSGTPAYMAPETARDPRAIDQRSDLYALGCVGYWLLTGRLVFTAKTAMEMLVAHVSQTPDPPSVHTELPVPEDFEQVIMSCLAKNPDDRPRSATAIARALDACACAGEWNRDRAEKWWRTHLRERVREPKAMARTRPEGP